MAHVLIAGAGYVGRPLVDLLRAAGHRVTALRRHPSPDGRGAARLAADVTRPETLAALPDDLDAVVCALAPATRDEAAYRQIFIDGTGHLLERLAERPGPFLFVSSTGVYGEDRGGWVDEDTPPGPTTATGRILLEAEERVLAARSDTMIVRFSGIYGPGRTWLIDRVRSGRPVQADPPSFTNRIHRDDGAGALAHLLGRALAGDTLPRVVLVSDDEPAPLAEVTAWLAGRLDVACPPNAPVDPAAPRNKRCRNERLRNLGYTLQYASYREGYAQVLGEMER